MANRIELWRWWVRDPLTGKRRRTSYGMTEDEARARHPGAEKVEGTKEVRAVDPTAFGYGGCFGSKRD
jgi:hypothetical protein